MLCLAIVAYSFVIFKVSEMMDCVNLKVDKNDDNTNILVVIKTMFDTSFV
jgi:hypothetical protein